MTKPLIPEQKYDALREFISWTIGTKNQPSLVNSRQQKEFEQVLSSETALQHFRLRKDLAGSLLYTEFNAEQISERLHRAQYLINDCLINLLDVREDTRVSSAFDSLEKSYQKAKVFMTAEEQRAK